MHGGNILKVLDQAAYACASRYAGHYVVTLSVDQVMFRQPIHAGVLVTSFASVNHTGKVVHGGGYQAGGGGYSQTGGWTCEQLLLHPGGR